MNDGDGSVERHQRHKRYTKAQTNSVSSRLFECARARVFVCVLVTLRVYQFAQNKTIQKTLIEIFKIQL